MQLLLQKSEASQEILSSYVSLEIKLRRNILDIRHIRQRDSFDGKN